MALVRWLSIVCLAGLAASPALALKVIDDQPGRRAAVQPVSQQALVDPARAAPGGLSSLETAVMLLGSLVFSAALLGRKPD
ncbi:MAG: hypothetical protein ACMVO5_01945 [Polymorphobacter sp.]|uniref:hypothetical protein n=1 Tax=Polymorphobacter sp. TaxID=1909290 RepID=UPI003A874DD5